MEVELNLALELLAESSTESVSKALVGSLTSVAGLSDGAEGLGLRRFEGGALWTWISIASIYSSSLKVLRIGRNRAIRARCRASKGRGRK